MSRIISTSVWGLALAALAAFSAIPASAATVGGGGENSPHILLVRGGGGGGGGHGGFGGFSGGGGEHSFGGGGGQSFSGSEHALSEGGGVSHSFNQGGVTSNSRSFSGNAGNFANGNHSSFYNGGRGNYDGYGRGGWNNGNWAWRGGNGYYGGWGGWGWGYPLAGWLGGYGWWYPGYGYGYGYYPYDYGDNYAYAEPDAVAPTTAAQQQPDQMANAGGGNQYLDEALQSFQSGNYSNAMRMAEHAIVDSPRDAEAHEIVSLAAMANKDYRTAATEAHAVIALGGVPSWNQVYAIYQNVDAYTQQLRELESYVKAHPKSAEGQFLLGVQYMTTGYATDAHDHFAAAAQLTPKDKIAQDLVNGANGQVPSTANRPGAPETK